MTRNYGLTALSSVFAVSVLAACAGGNPLTAERNVAALQTSSSQPGSGFTQNLAHEYLKFSSGEVKQAYDWIDGDHFARKGIQAAHGQTIPPEQVNSWNIPQERRGELSDARTRLVTALDGGGRDRAAPLAAKAQARYDCWIEQQEENWQTQDIASCRGEFITAMGELEAALHPPAVAGSTAPPEYRTFFEFDSADLQPEARQLLQQVASEMNESSSTTRVILVGNADRVGTDQYNLGLSGRRTAAVRNELVRLGVPRDRISEEALGESQPLVPTPDGVKEPRNRVVQINIPQGR